jgi:hypothetical protein
MTLRQAAKAAKDELQSEAITVIKKSKLSTYDIFVAHKIAELTFGKCEEIIEGRKVRYLITKQNKR